jgi:hypothetical protein
MSYFQNDLLDTMLHCGADKLAALGREHVQLADRRQAAR